MGLEVGDTLCWVTYPNKVYSDKVAKIVRTKYNIIIFLKHHNAFVVGSKSIGWVGEYVEYPTKSFYLGNPDELKQLVEIRAKSPEALNTRYIFRKGGFEWKTKTWWL